MKHPNDQGFTGVAVLIIGVIIVALCAVGWVVYRAQNDASSAASTNAMKPSSTNSPVHGIPMVTKISNDKPYAPNPTARDSARQSIAKTIRGVVADYYNKNKTFPTLKQIAQEPLLGQLSASSGYMRDLKTDDYYRLVEANPEVGQFALLPGTICSSQRGAAIQDNTAGIFTITTKLESGLTWCEDNRYLIF